jgi:hypothetical protein
MRAAILAVLVLAAACGQAPVIDHRGDPGTPPPRAGAAATYDGANGTIVMFGGADRSGVSNETWTWDGTGWRLQHPKTSPPAREFAFMGFDPATKRVVLFGGLTCPAPSVEGALGCDYQSNPTVLSDTWTWDGSAWSKLETRHSPPVVDFRCCFGGAAADPSHGNLILVTSGALDSNVLVQTWVLQNGDWQRLHPKHSPPTLEFSNPAFDEVSGRLIVQQSAGPHVMCPTTGCGNLPTLTHDTTWSWDGSDWNDLGTAAKTPHDYGQLLSVGRHGLLLIWSNNVYQWNGSSWASSQQLALPEAVSPMLRPRYEWAAAYHQPTDRLVLIGGRDFGGNHLFGSTAGWDGVSWVTLAPAPPSPSIPLIPCSATKASGGVGWMIDPSNPATTNINIDFFEPAAGPCHLTATVVMSLTDRNGSLVPIAGNPSSQPVNADLTWDAGGQRVTFALTGFCSGTSNLTAEIRAGDLQQSEPVSVQCLSSSHPPPSITPSVQASGLRP